MMRTDDQQDRREDADRGVGGQQADHEGGQPHHDQRGHQDRLAADLVAEVAADDAAERAGGEPDPEGGERRQGAGDRARAREERVPKYRAAAVPNPMKS